MSKNVWFSQIVWMKSFYYRSTFKKVWNIRSDFIVAVD